MRTTHIMSVLALVALMASCAPTYISRTATTKEIKAASIQQLPLVVELKVDPKLDSQDTAWSYRKRCDFTRRDAEKYLAAGILSKNQADVLVLPRVSFYKKTSFGRTECQMRVEGYPARYTNFHTASKQDYQILRGEFEDDTLQVVCQKTDTVFCPIVINVINNEAAVTPQQERDAIATVSEKLSKKLSLDTIFKKKKKK